MSARSGYDFIRTVVFVREFLRGSGSVEMFCFNKCLFSNFEVREQRPAAICWPLIPFLGLGKLMSEFHMEFVQVNHILMSALRS